MSSATAARLDDSIAETPAPPYVAVIFTSRRTAGDDGYGDMANRMTSLGSQQPGFLGIESAREDGLGITVSYWRSVADARAWKQVAAHAEAQVLGRERWYTAFKTRIASVSHDKSFRCGR